MNPGTTVTSQSGGNRFLQGRFNQATPNRPGSLQGREVSSSTSSALAGPVASNSELAQNNISSRNFVLTTSTISAPNHAAQLIRDEMRNGALSTQSADIENLRTMLSGTSQEIVNLHASIRVSIETFNQRSKAAADQFSEYGRQIGRQIISGQILPSNSGDNMNFLSNVALEVQKIYGSLVEQHLKFEGLGAEQRFKDYKSVIEITFHFRIKCLEEMEKKIIILQKQDEAELAAQIKVLKAEDRVIGRMLEIAKLQSSEDQRSFDNDLKLREFENELVESERKHQLELEKVQSNERMENKRTDTHKEIEILHTQVDKEKSLAQIASNESIEKARVEADKEKALAQTSASERIERVRTKADERCKIIKSVLSVFNVKKPF